MNTAAQSDGGHGFTISFSRDDLTSISGNGHTGNANMRQVRLAVGKKIMREIILPTYHSIPEGKMEHELRRVELGKVRLRTSKNKHTVLLLEIVYRFKEEGIQEGYRRVFEFVSKSGGLTGKLHPRKTRPIRNRDATR